MVPFSSKFNHFQFFLTYSDIVTVTVLKCTESWLEYVIITGVYSDLEFYKKQTNSELHNPPFKKNPVPW